MREGVECFQVMNNKPELMSLLKFISRFNIFTPTREEVSRKLLKHLFFHDYKEDVRSGGAGTRHCIQY